MEPNIPVVAVLKRDRAAVVAGLGGVTALAWLYLLHVASSAQGMEAMGAAVAGPQMRAWGAVDFALMLVMWVVMMVAMMLPSAAPMILLFAAVNRREHGRQPVLVPTGLFAASYVLVWAGFAVLATLAQWALHTGALLTAMMDGSASPILGGGLLVAAGLYQWTPLKRACLARCRTPLGFLMAEWRPGAHGALVMGLRHGVYCLGCCWVLMTLLFVGGAMNLLWVAAIAAFVLLEKLAPAGHWVGRVAGTALALWGAWLLLAALGSRAM